MEDLNNLIYGLEYQARSLCPQLAENNEIRFFLATQSLKPNNQIHMVKVDDELKPSAKNHMVKVDDELKPSAKIHRDKVDDELKSLAKIFSFDSGEIWKLNTSPHDAKSLLAVYSRQKPSSAQIINQTALLTLPNEEDMNDSSEFCKFDKIEVLDTEAYGAEVKTTEYHPTNENSLATVVDSKIVIFDRTTGQSSVAAEISGKNSSHFTTGRWSQHHQGNQFIALHDTCVKSYDIRDQNLCAWQIEEAHGQLVRDLDCNPNKQCHFVTGGDDCTLKVWDSRMIGNKPVFSRNDHSHWIWSVRFNTFHDQLILSSSSDCKVLLTCAGTVSSEVGENSEENEHKGKIADGLLQTFDQHEDSVYCVEWSNVDPWVFASLSYDGRLTISRVPKQFKYQILF